MNRKLILIVDDSDSICSAVGMMLRVYGYDSMTAADGLQGVELAREHGPDAILLDIMMPRLDGWGAIRELKSGPATAEIPVIALTALYLSEEQVEAAGFHGYLRKPVSAHRLRDELQLACDGSPQP